MPPTNVLLGRNPTLEAAELIQQGFMAGQYYTSCPGVKPGDFNNMLEAKCGFYMDPIDYGKTYVRKITKVGSCKYCLGPMHADHRTDPCLYKNICRECLVPFKDMPDGGFHHSCANLVISTPRPTEAAKGQKRKLAYDPGLPKTQAQTTYEPSLRHIQRQRILAAAAAAAKARHDEMIAAAAENPDPGDLMDDSEPEL